MRLAAVLSLAAVVAGVGCSEPVGPPLPTNPPQVFLTVDGNNVAAREVTGKVNTSGCKNVAQLQLLEGNTFLADVPYTSSPSSFTLPEGLFSSLYSKRGLAVSLTLKARVVCDDGRTNDSLPQGVSFFPIDTRFTTGGQVVPTFFIAEGGLSGSATTFLGCAVTQTGTTIARMNTRGEVVAFVPAMPIDCSANTQITDLSAASGYRWVYEPGAGAFALNMSDFSVGRVMKSGTMASIGVGAGGTAVVWLNGSATQNKLCKLSPAPQASQTTCDWEASFNGIMNSTPLVIDLGGDQAVWVTRWELDIGTRVANITPFKYNVLNGALLNGTLLDSRGYPVPPVMVQQQYPVSQVSEPIVPQGVFAADGVSFTIPLLSYDPHGNLQTTIISCSTAGGLCEGTGWRRWTSTTFPGLLGVVVPFSSNNLIAAAGAKQVWFLTAQSGVIANLSEKAIEPTGSQVVVGLLPGLGADFYILTGPDFGGEQASYATELIAVDQPQRGELWRVGYGSGESPQNGMHIGVDQAGQPWLRMGLDLVKPRSNEVYRAARGETMVP